MEDINVYNIFIILIYTAVQKFGVSKFFFIYIFLKDVSYATKAAFI